MKKIFLILILSLLPHATLADNLQPEDLTQGGYILYFRHAEADVGRDCKDPSKPDWWKSTDPKLTRQLSDKGRRQARVIGEAFRRLEIPVGTFLCSEFRRTQDTARLMNLGELRPESDLTPLVVRGDLEKRLIPRLTEKPTEGTNTVLVAHGHVLPVFEKLNEGEAMVFKPGQEKPLGTIPFAAWEKAAGKLLFESQFPEDRFLLKDGTLTIVSRRGVGQVKITPANRKWPVIKTLRFEYPDGRGMKRLEGLRVKTDSPKAYNSLPRPVKDGAVEVILPPELPQSAPVLNIHWVDFYR